MTNTSRVVTSFIDWLATRELMPQRAVALWLTEMETEDKEDYVSEYVSTEQRTEDDYDLLMNFPFSTF